MAHEPHKTPTRKQRKTKTPRNPAKKCIQWNWIYNPDQHHKTMEEHTKKRLATNKSGDRARHTKLRRQKIEEALIEGAQHGYFPTANELAEKLGISHGTVKKDLLEIDFTKIFAPMKTVMAKKLPDVIKSLYDKTQRGDVQAIKLFMQLVGYVETKEVKQDTEVKIVLEKKIISSPEEFRSLTDVRTATPAEDAEFEEVK